ncbi:hypothetical protein BJY00DRAFT_157699 [Aspergillus carlsbadensis]|nr:hypothetical protein BJY00DRAFT_157699 [Aspergillus carlsbadensis]
MTAPQSLTTCAGLPYILAGARLEFISPAASFPPCPASTGQEARHRLHWAVAEVTGTRQDRKRSSADGMQSGLSLSACCMTNAGQNAGSSSDSPINPPLSGRASRLTRICRVPRTNWTCSEIAFAIVADEHEG